MNKIFGYARVSTPDQNLDTQLNTLQRAGCEEIFQDKITDMLTGRPALDELQTRLHIGRGYGHGYPFLSADPASDSSAG